MAADESGRRPVNGELPSELHWLSASEAAYAIAHKQVSPVELTQALLARIQRLDPRHNAFIKVCLLYTSDAADE